MVKTILHTRVSESFYFEQSPHEIVHHIETAIWHNLSVTVQENSEHFNFKILKLNEQHPEITITGTIRHWQGTNSRCDFEGLVDVPSPNTTLQQAWVVLIVAIVSVIFWRWILIDLGGLLILFDLPLVMGLSIISMEVPIAIIIGGISYSLIVRDTSDKRRWQVQQDMGKIIEGLYTLGTPLENETAS